MTNVTMTTTLENLITEALDASRAIDAVVEGELDYVENVRLHSKLDFVAIAILQNIAASAGDVYTWYDPSWWASEPVYLQQLTQTMQALGLTISG